MMLPAINRVTAVITALLCILCIGILIWGMNKGFDFSDEGFSLLSLSKDQEQGMEIMPVYPILQRCFSVFDPGIVFYRLLRLLLFMGGTAVFLAGLLSCLRNRLPAIQWPSFMMAYPVLIIAGLINYSVFYQSLSYNSLTLAVMLTATGLLFKSMSLQDGKPQHLLRCYLFITGLAFGFLYLIKLSTGILFLMVSVLFIFFGLIEKRKLSLLPGYLILLACGISLSILLLYAAGISPMSFAGNIRKASVLLPAHQFTQLLEVYLDDLHKNFLNVILYHKAFLFFPFLLWLLYRFSFSGMFVAVFALSLLLLLWKFMEDDWYKAGMEGMAWTSQVYILLLWSFFIFILPELLFFLFRFKNHESASGIRSLAAVFLFLFCCPFAASAGTNNPLSVHITQFLIFWYVVFLLIIELIAHQSKHYQMLKPLFTLALIFMVSAQFVFGFVRSPYRLQQGLDKQKYYWSSGRNAPSVLLDAPSYRFVATISEVLKKHGYDQGGYQALSLYSYPGLVYLLKATSPGAAWYFSDGYGRNDAANCYMILKSGKTGLKRTVIFMDSDSGIKAAFADCLKTKGILFPEHYFCADSVMVPDASGYLKIYLPK